MDSLRRRRALQNSSYPSRWEDDEIDSGDGDDLFLDIASSFHWLSRVDLGEVALRDGEDELPLTMEYCRLDRIKLVYTGDTILDSEYEDVDDSD